MPDEQDNAGTTIVLRTDPDVMEELSDYLNALGNPTRLRILRSISHKPKDVRELSREIRTSYENTKKHLDKLLLAGLIKKEAGLSAETAKGVHPVWKYSLIPGGMEAIIRNLGVFSNIGITLRDEEIARRICEVREMIAGEGEAATPVLMLLGGADDGKVYPLSAERIAVGRHDPAVADIAPPLPSDVVLSDEYQGVTRVSRPHARIGRTEAGWQIEDCGSTGGTYLNNILLKPHLRHPLAEGDLIDLGKGLRGARFVFTTPPAP